MLQQELLKKVTRILDEIEIEYMATGSLVSSLQGEPRSTHDVDFVVDIRKSQIKKLLEAFPPPDYYLDERSIVSAISRKRMFNLVHTSEGDKVDFWILTDDPFDKSRFSRRITEKFMGLELLISSPEDTILAKLKWAKMSGGSEKQYIDALRVYEVQHDKMDVHYLEEWTKKLKVESLWNRLVKEAEII